MHHNGKLAVLVELNCETDFVARTDDFKDLAKHVAEHVAPVRTRYAGVLGMRAELSV